MNLITDNVAGIQNSMLDIIIVIFYCNNIELSAMSHYNRATFSETIKFQGVVGTFAEDERHQWRSQQQLDWSMVLLMIVCRI